LKTRLWGLASSISTAVRIVDSLDGGEESASRIRRKTSCLRRDRKKGREVVGWGRVRAAGVWGVGLVRCMFVRYSKMGVLLRDAFGGARA
jgi:hypothetical protein